MRDRCLMLAAGTGHDFQFFPPGLRITAIDLSGLMLAHAAPLARAYPSPLDLVQIDAQALAFGYRRFDTIVSICTFCSVPDPVQGLCELRRVIAAGGWLLAFQHVRSRLGPIAIMQDLLTPFSRRVGPDLNRHTLGDLTRAGFRVLRVQNVYRDVVKAIEATPD